MSGHNKWASIKHKKAAADAKRGAAFTKIIREITVAAKTGGGDPSMNPRLRTAIQAGKDANMPADNIERAIKKGTGELEGVTYEEVTYEGFGPGGAAFLVACLTDNKNRSASEIRSIFGKNGGNMGSAGGVAWMFEKKGLIVVSTSTTTEDKLMETALNAGAEDMAAVGETFQVTTAPADLWTVRDAIEKSGIKIESANLTMNAKNMTTVDVAAGRTVVKLIEALEEHDDVQNVYTNADIPDEVMKEITG
ncbi:MAG TPA: YebC/PmpR family DNA-binding transcriptional regulator [Candidatus Omnitrophota bacterium]|jgi:YebC/PmpR family DNA-binding regulatory protein|nr:MAG: putative transcriptional regulatory protein [Candidatus Omnitrophica bacterium ADurb.Bin314]HOE68763.1 YebC/PmpR family DNA-binding transcriptional regulator [Candidatus Omnitrophota bacterium]HPW64542.1 YebC/PmpR family DNA-binding transcriptional regulator [Candidatus Omnitrophota bacterium]HQB94229.1 YebC/PmpR family DNA-binding transcriptional regulator [Candidatus Omnitrophota bacterium]